MSGRVILVDEDPNEFGELAVLLREDGYEVEIVRSGQKALDRVPELLPDLVLLDTELPDIDGITVCERLSKDERVGHIPIIVLGSTDDVRVKVEAIRRGGIDFISKPFQVADILARVGRQVTVGRIRAALQQSEAEFRSVTDSAIDAIISADTTGTIRSWNPAASRVFGYDRDEMIGENLERIIPQRFRDAHHEGIARVSGGGPSRVIGSTVEVSAIRKDGSEIPVELSLATWSLDDNKYYTGIIRDISDRKEAEQKFRSVTESAIDAIVSSDKTSTVVGWNQAATDIFGWEAEELLGKPLETIIPERFRDAHRAGMDRMTNTGESRVIGNTVELSGLRKDGSEFPIELSLSSWMVDDQRFYTGIIRDITTRKTAEEKLQRYAEDLARQHDELQRQHDELQRSREALHASFKQAQKLFSAVTDGLPGAVLNEKYRLDRKIGAGGYGVVYEGTQLALERRVAIKVLRPPTHEDEDTLFERFRREGVTTCKVNHLNAVSVLDLDVSEGGFPYIVMEYLDGETLDGRLKGDAFISPVQALGIAADVANVLAAIHRAGVIHRDIKPSNIFLQLVGDADTTDEVVKVLDFGIARLMDEPGRSRVTRSGELLGTPSFMAPERLSRSLPEGPSSDIYSLAVVLYRVLAGRLPIEARQDLLQTIGAHLTEEPPLLTEIQPSLPASLSKLTARALAGDPDRRPSAADFETELRAILESMQVG